MYFFESFLSASMEAATARLSSEAKDLEQYFNGQTPTTPAAVALSIRSQLSSSFEKNFPMLRALCSPHLRSRHWEAISNTVGIALDPLSAPAQPSETSPTAWFTLSLATDMDVNRHVDKLCDIAERAR